MAWTSLTSFSGNPAPVTTDGTLIFLGDFDTNGLWAYDVGTDTYENWGVFPVANWSSGFLQWVPDWDSNGPAILYSNTEELGTMYLYAYQPVSNAGVWSAALTPDPIPTGRRDMHAYGFTSDIGASGSIIVAGGYDLVNVTDDVRLYDISTDTWSAVAPLPVPNGEVQGAWSGGLFYVFGGWDSPYTPSGFVYDPDLDSWDTLTVPFDSDTAGWPAVAAFATGGIFVGAGYGDNQSDDTWVYDPVADTWTSEDALPFADYASAVTIGATAYVLRWNSGGDLVSLTFGAFTSAAAGVATGTGTVYVPTIEGTGTCRWSFYDAAASTSYNFAINPNAGGSPQRKKTVATQRTAAVGGKVLMFEGADQVPTIEWSGCLLREQDIAVYQEWYAKNHQIQVTDDLGRSFYILIQGFTTKREPTHQHPFRVTYTLRALTLDWPSASAEIPEPGRISKSSSDTAAVGDNNGGWQEIAGSPTDRVKEAVYDGTYIYMPDSSGVFHRYNPVADTWAVMAAPNINVQFDFFGISYDPTTNAIYIVGDSSNTYIYDVALDSWSLGTGAPDYVDWMMAARVDRTIFIAGGFSDNEAALYGYDIDLDTWTQYADMPGVLAEVGMVAVNDGAATPSDFLYVFGGWNDDTNDYIPTGYKYDVTNDTWSTITVEFNNESAGMPAVVTSGDYIYLVNGWGDDDTAATWQYNWVTEDWAPLLDNTYERYATAVIDTDDVIYTFSRQFSATASKSVTAIEVS